MADGNGQKPAGYGHDNKGAAGGENTGAGKPGVAHSAPADKVSGAGHNGKAVSFFLDGKEVTAREGETIWQVAKRQGIDIPHLCYSPEPGYRADGNCRACMVEIEGERVLAASCIRKPSEGMKVNASNARAKTARRMVFELLISDQPERATSHDPQSKFWSWADRMGIEVGRFPEREKMPAADRSHVAMAVNLDACIQCNLCVRACREVQVNDVIGMAGRGHAREDRVRLRRPDGAVDLRRLRRMRAGLPDRRADAGDLGRRQQRAHRISRPRGAQRLPLLRRRLPAHLSHQGRQAAVRERPRRPGQPAAPVRERPLRLRLRQQSAAPAEADGAQGRRAQGAARGDRPGQSVDAFPRGELGGSARPRRFGPQENPRPRRPAGAWPASARPNARTRKPICSRSWCAPASAPTMSTTARGSATPPRWRRSWKASAPARCRLPSTSARIPTSSS